MDITSLLAQTEMLLDWYSNSCYPKLDFLFHPRLPLYRTALCNIPSWHCLRWCLFTDALFVPQVERLVEMGFSRIDALEALRASNNDINMATNFLLQHWERQLSERQSQVMRGNEKKKAGRATEAGKAKKQNRHKERQWLMEERERRQTIFVQIIWRRCHCSLGAVLGWPVLI